MDADKAEKELAHAVEAADAADAADQEPEAPPGWAARVTDLLFMWYAILLLLGFVLTWAVTGNRFRYLVASATARGTVTTVDAAPDVMTSRDGEGGKQGVHYEFHDEQGNSHTGSLSVLATSTHFKVGQTLIIQYLNSEPGINRVHSPWRMADEPWLLYVVLLVTLGVVLGLAWWFNRSDVLTALIVRLARPTLFRAVARLWRRRRVQELAEEFPFDWVGILRRNVRLYNMLKPVEQEQLHGLIKFFVVGRAWEGCKGQGIDDEVRVTIAGQACMLLLGRPDDDFDNVSSILVYPSSFKTGTHAVLGEHGHAVLEGEVHTLGQAVYRGPVVFAWDEVLSGGRDPADGRNVVFHEFAHQLDFGGDTVTTVESELERQRRRQEVFKREYDRLVDDTQHDRESLLDKYGATDPAEFFAVATETFFELPINLRTRHPELYDVLRDFYGQDTARRFELSNVEAFRPSADIAAVPQE